MSGHYDESGLWPYLEGRMSSTEQAAIDAHLGNCAACSALAGSMRTFVTTLGEPAVWLDEEPRLPVAPLEPPPGLLAYARLDRQEKERAARAIQQVTSAPDNALQSVVNGEPAFHTLAGARLLLGEARQQLERSPRRSLELVDIATRLLLEIPEERYPRSAVREAEGMAWKERSNALRFLGSLPDAEEALETAATILGDCPASSYQLAGIDLARAILRLETDRTAEAVRFARDAAVVFLDHGDTSRWLQARFLEGVTLYTLGGIAEARALFFELLKPAQDIGNAETLARLFHNIGRTSVDLGDTEAAAFHLHQAMRLYDELGIQTEKVRIRWALGRLMIGTGKTVEGLDRLRQSQREFETLGMDHDAALVALELVEALLATGEAGEIREVCARLIERFSHEGAQSSAMTALGYLHDAIASGRATPRAVRHVRSHFEALAQTSDRVFLPLPYADPPQHEE